MGNIIKSKERVKKCAEVFTPIHIVKKMIDMVEYEGKETDVWEIGKTWMEPSCGNGVFIGEIVRRKLRMCSSLEQGASALKDVYAIDIQQDNVEQARCQAMGQFVVWCTTKGFEINTSFLKHVFSIVEKNFIVGDFLKPETITIYDWKEDCEMSLSECMS